MTCTGAGHAANGGSWVLNGAGQLSWWGTKATYSGASHLARLAFAAATSPHVQVQEEDSGADVKPVMRGPPRSNDSKMPAMVRTESTQPVLPIASESSDTTPLREPHPLVHRLLNPAYTDGTICARPSGIKGTQLDTVANLVRRIRSAGNLGGHQSKTSREGAGSTNTDQATPKAGGGDMAVSLADHAGKMRSSHSRARQKAVTGRTTRQRAGKGRQANPSLPSHDDNGSTQVAGPNSLRSSYLPSAKACALTGLGALIAAGGLYSAYQSQTLHSGINEYVSPALTSLNATLNSALEDERVTKAASCLTDFTEARLTNGLLDVEPNRARRWDSGRALPDTSHRVVCGLPAHWPRWAVMVGMIPTNRWIEGCGEECFDELAVM
ncbi:uncharacterized protein MKK02DRAFT_31027 [Dioszegia hungarica]|uniref:Uncharacterized protein n=1 Tax=Dioszegia hungarica TaxID=4972 RepID=A0AA38H3I0_9TREE|nr:uncharacterized protein MKK02DRAFT_31027 [Dioszegia hungarica]KAI9632074.1 hypothetical protein MKK02DRAFT_31027 [Dioszegia hungarica]